MFRFILALTVACGALFAEEEGLLFKSTFDVYNTTPDFAKGSREASGIPKDLQLRMSPGIAAPKSNAVVLNGKERIVYSAVGNFDPRQGTVSLWIKPENWAPDNPYYQIFFQIREPDFVFLIYKLMRTQTLAFYIKVKDQVYAAQASAKSWKPGNWYKLDAVWNRGEMRLYINGKCDTPAQVKKLGAGFILPDPLKKGAITLNEYEWWHVNKEYATAFDDLKIYDRCLSQEEILTAYEKAIPPVRTAVIEPPRVTVPQTRPKITLDGKIDPAEWENASSIPIRCQSPNDGNQPESAAAAFLQADSDTLYIAMRANRPATKAVRTEPDGELWLEDSFEVHFYGKDGKHRQIIVSPLGTVYDALDGRKEWSSGVKTAAFRSENGWSMELALPLASLGKVNPGDVLPANFCYSELSKHPVFHAWGMLLPHRSYGDKELCGKVRFGTDPLAVVFENRGEFKNGDINFFTDVKNGTVVTDFTLKDNQGKVISKEQVAPGIPFRKTISPGRYIFQMETRAPDNTILYSLEFPETVKEVLTLAVECYPSKELFKIQIEVQDASCSGGTVILTDASGKEVLAEVPFKVVRKHAEVTLPFPAGMKENRQYLIRVRPNGVRFLAEQKITIPDLKAIASYANRDHSVPPPWIPVVVEGKTIRVLDRVYTFENSPFPSKIVSRGQTVLDASPELILNGQQFEWSGLQITQAGQEKAEICAKGHLGTATILWKGELWFDGMYNFSMELTPSAPLEITSLNLRWAMPSAAARYVMNPNYQKWENNSLRLHYTPKENSSLLWLTGVENGLAWWCESDANFVNAPDEKQITLRRTGDKVDVNIGIISLKCCLKGKAVYTMMFQATPSRRPPKDWQNVNFGFGHPRTNFHVNYESETNPKAATAIDSLTTMRPFDDAAMTRFTQELKKKRNARLTIYTMPVHIANNQPEFLFFEREWMLTPPTTWSSFKDGDGKGITIYPFCTMTPAKDLYAARTEKFFADHPDLGGIYYDICHVASCDNALHGCGGVDAFGKPYSKSTALGLRSYLMRIYKLHRKYGANLLNHAHNYFFPFVHDFGDSWIPGEQYIWEVGKNPKYFYFEGIPPEEYQCAYNSEIRGVGIYEIIQLCRAAEFVPELKPKKAEILSEEYGIHALAPALLHNLGITPGVWGGKIVSTWRQIKEEVNLPQADFHPYWISDAVRSGTPGILCSWYEWKTPSPFSRMMVIANSGREPGKLSLKVDWKALNLSPEKVRLQDLWNRKELSLSSLENLSLEGNHFLLIGISEKESR